MSNALPGKITNWTHKDYTEAAKKRGVNNADNLPVDKAQLTDDIIKWQDENAEVLAYNSTRKQKDWKRTTKIPDRIGVAVHKIAMMILRSHSMKDYPSDFHDIAYPLCIENGLRAVHKFDRNRAKDLDESKGLLDGQERVQNGFSAIYIYVLRGALTVISSRKNHAKMLAEMTSTAKHHYQDLYFDGEFSDEESTLAALIESNENRTTTMMHDQEGLEVIKEAESAATLVETTEEVEEDDDR